MTRVFVALDVPDAETAEQWMRRLHPHRSFKVGLELFLAAGPDRVARWAGEGAEVFLDLKLHDIPNTVGAALRQVRRLGARLVTVHAAGGAEMIRAAVEEAAGDVTVVAVTVLTSLGPGSLAALGLPPPRVWAERLARTAVEAGVGGLVTSGEEVAALARTWPHLRRVVPGIRPTGVQADDQVRIVTPATAVRRGATDLVVGRPVLRAADPAAMLARILAEVEATPPGSDPLPADPGHRDEETREGANR
jgi:orotidine-5'-phosphate decarboxylase